MDACGKGAGGVEGGLDSGGKGACDKAKFGGSNTLKRPCIHRKCVNSKAAVTKPPKVETSLHLPPTAGDGCADAAAAGTTSGAAALAASAGGGGGGGGGDGGDRGAGVDSSSKTAEAAVLGVQWVACSSCDKWRALDPRREPIDTRGDWYCQMNTDPTHNTCHSSEASASNRGDDDRFDQLCSFFVAVGGDIDDLYGWQALDEEGACCSAQTVAHGSQPTVYYAPWGERACYPATETVSECASISCYALTPPPPPTPPPSPRPHFALRRIHVA